MHRYMQESGVEWVKVQPHAVWMCFLPHAVLLSVTWSHEGCVFIGTENTQPRCFVPGTEEANCTGQTWSPSNDMYSLRATLTAVELFVLILGCVHFPVRKWKRATPWGKNHAHFQTINRRNGKLHAKCFNGKNDPLCVAKSSLEGIFESQKQTTTLEYDYTPSIRLEFHLPSW